MIESPPEPPQHYLSERNYRIIQPAVASSAAGAGVSAEPRVFSLKIANQAASWLQDVFSRVSELTALREDWDTYGARPVTAAAAINVVQFLHDHAYSDLSRPSVVPTSDGGIQLEWHRGGVDLEIAFSDDDPGIYAVDLDSGEEFESDGLAEAGPLLARFRRRLAA